MRRHLNWTITRSSFIRKLKASIKEDYLHKKIKLYSNIQNLENMEISLAGIGDLSQEKFVLSLNQIKKKLEEFKKVKYDFKLHIEKELDDYFVKLKKVKLVLESLSPTPFNQEIPTKLPITNFPKTSIEQIFNLKNSISSFNDRTEFSSLYTNRVDSKNSSRKNSMEQLRTISLKKSTKFSRVEPKPKY